VKEQFHQDKEGMNLDLGEVPAVELQLNTVEEMYNSENRWDTMRIRAHPLEVVLRDRSVILRADVLANSEVEGPDLTTYLFYSSFLGSPTSPRTSTY
jgi:hypothetical protein